MNSQDDPDVPVQLMLHQWAVERPDLDATAMALFGRLSRAHAMAEVAIERTLETFGLQRGEFDVLATLRRAGSPFELTPGRLAAAMLLSPAATTHRLAKLEILGLIQRAPDPADGRGSLVSLTPKGRSLVDRAVKVHAAGLAELLRGLRPVDQKQLSTLLGALLGSIGRPHGGNDR